MSYKEQECSLCRDWLPYTSLTQVGDYEVCEYCVAQAENKMKYKHQIEDIDGIGSDDFDANR